MATRKQRERSERIFAAALAEFAHRGLHQANVNAIAEAAGVSKATLYNHFATKEALFLEVFKQVLDRLTELTPAGPRPMAAPTGGGRRAPGSVHAPTSFDDGVRISVRRFFQQTAASPAIEFFFRTLTSETDVVDEGMRQRMLDTFFAATVANEATELWRRAADGVRPHLATDIVHHASVGAFLFALRHWLHQSPRPPVGVVADQVAEIILGGISVSSRFAFSCHLAPDPRSPNKPRRSKPAPRPSTAPSRRLPLPAKPNKKKKYLV